MLALSLGTVSVACGEPPSVGAGWPTGTGGETSASAGAVSTGAVSTGPGDRPEVIDVGIDVLVLREGEAVVVTAVVSDPDDDVREGELFGPGEPASYGAMEPESAGRWRSMVTWSDVHERWPLEFEREVELPFVVRFVDAQGHEGEGGVVVRAICGGLTDTACDGVCVDVQVDAMHCGGCGQPCEAEVGACINGLCQ
ncbi:hypothetical protein [Paraliomyxa miuraensis]|uniref:hypothetical protein n=1 Tax=Paraliomyxa miuraensis TaxID=376150 RepID=UPI00224ED465|nr:hypothetical protein [Paraliomyxa miuraensis]MCX4246120.1 hypothetical protein [Paraliomyxa miuraensis]